MDFKDIVIYSDIDGTLAYGVDGNSFVSGDNLSAIKEFIDLGGHFGISSGRNHFSVIDLFNGLKFNMPYVEANGARTYDSEEDKYISVCYFKKEHKKMIYDYAKKRGDVCITAMDTDCSKKILFNDDRDEIFLDYWRPSLTYEEYMKRDMLKVAFIAEASIIDEIAIEAEKFEYASEFTRSRSYPLYLEMFDIKASKGNAITSVMEIDKYKNKKLVCIGDYDNDVSMLKIADIAICPNDALEDIKPLCNYITVDHKTGIMPDVLKYLRSL